MRYGLTTRIRVVSYLCARGVVRCKIRLVTDLARRKNIPNVGGLEFVVVAVGGVGLRRNEKPRALTLTGWS
jgi:hypothetical protein